MHKDSVLAIIGGGRWGRVYLSILANIISLRFKKIVMVSQYNAEKISTLTSKHQLISSIPIEMVSSIEELCALNQVKAAIIVNEAEKHFETAQFLINKGCNLLIEKPVVLETRQITLLIEQAKAMRVVLVPGLTYRFCAYIDNFSKILFQHIEEFNEAPTFFSIEWSDPSVELRYGETKKYDPKVNLAQDIMPHIWTILYGTFKTRNIIVKSCQTINEFNGNFLVEIDQKLQGNILLKREAMERKRKIEVKFSSKTTLLDFTKEPGNISKEENSISGASIPGDPNWQEKSSPLTLQLNYFFSRIENSKLSDIECIDNMDCIDSVVFSNSSSILLNHQSLINQETYNVL
jgi:hypothetical protein